MNHFTILGDVVAPTNIQIYYSFKGGSLTDYSSHGIHATAFGALVTTTGRVDEAIQFDSGAYISNNYHPFDFSRVNDYSYTMALWAKPTGSNSAQTLVFVSTSTGWCAHFIATTSTGVLTVNSWMDGPVGALGPLLTLNTWTHIGYTYSPSNGIRLYVNGELYSSSVPFTFSAPGAPVTITLGTDNGETGCTPGYGGAFVGALDEFYLYNVELTAAQIWTLAHP
ncbi:unnamed protein product [Rotaria socialis]|uniref:LamG-like jellyroll fold domain-containing protein n=1 Tax=Rotaria socialis TaxID=392032 RepID=A0A818QNL6_9BILA|nr:unnamed protein product [Rotaria socialis]CAF4897137.1 unnamed protein product [Rotaria socialis]